MVAVANRTASGFPEGGSGNLFITARLDVREIDPMFGHVAVLFTWPRCTGTGRDVPVSVNWGDGSRESVPYEGPPYYAEHSYLETGSYVISVRADVASVGVQYSGYATDAALFHLYDLYRSGADLSVTSLWLVPRPGMVIGETDPGRPWWEPSSSIPRGLFSGLYSSEFLALPEGVTTLGISTFDGCPSLRTVDLPSSLASLSDRCFGDAKLDDLTLRSGLPVAYDGALGYGSVGRLHVPSELVLDYAASPWADVAGEIVAI